MRLIKSVVILNLLKLPMKELARQPFRITAKLQAERFEVLDIIGNKKFKKMLPTKNTKNTKNKTF